MTMMMMRLVALVALVVAASGFSPAPPRISITTSVGLRMSEEPAAEEAAAEPVKCPDCDMCDGSGRIAGGLGAVITWIPIKAYRPCPNFVDNGGFYQRQGQPLDEIAFGADSTYNR